MKNIFKKVNNSFDKFEDILQKTILFAATIIIIVPTAILSMLAVIYKLNGNWTIWKFIITPEMQSNLQYLSIIFILLITMYGLLKKKA